MSNIFSIFSKTNYSFEGKKDGEEVVIFLHRHWYTLVGKMVAIFGGILLPFIVLAIFGQLMIQFKVLSYVIVLCGFFYMMLWYMFFYTLTMYTLDSWIVTNLRVIDSTQHGFFNRKISELSIGNIQDVSVTVDGAVATMFNYGGVEIQSAGAEDKFHFKQVPNPQHVKDEIMRVVNEYKTKHFKSEAAEIIREIEEVKSV